MRAASVRAPDVSGLEMSVPSPRSCVAEGEVVSLLKEVQLKGQNV